MAKQDELTAKQSRFIDEYMKDLNGTQAVIRAGYSTKGADVQAVRLLGNARVKAEVEKRQAALAETHGVTLKSLLDELDEARAAALSAETVQSSAAVAATMAKAKLTGLVVDKVKSETSGTLTVKTVDKAPKYSREEWERLHGVKR